MTTEKQPHVFTLRTQCSMLGFSGLDMLENILQLPNDWYVYLLHNRGGKPETYATVNFHFRMQMSYSEVKDLPKNSEVLKVFNHHFEAQLSDSGVHDTTWGEYKEPMVELLTKALSTGCLYWGTFGHTWCLYPETSFRSKFIEWYEHFMTSPRGSKKQACECLLSLKQWVDLANQPDLSYLPNENTNLDGLYEPCEPEDYETDLIDGEYDDYLTY